MNIMLFGVIVVTISSGLICFLDRFNNYHSQATEVNNICLNQTFTESYIVSHMYVLKVILIPLMTHTYITKFTIFFNTEPLPPPPPQKKKKKKNDSLVKSDIFSLENPENQLIVLTGSLIMSYFVGMFPKYCILDIFWKHFCSTIAYSRSVLIRFARNLIHFFVVLENIFLLWYCIPCNRVQPKESCTRSAPVELGDILQGSLTGTGTITRLPQCQRSNPEGYGKITSNITTTKQTTTEPCAYVMEYNTHHALNTVQCTHNVYFL